MGDTLRALVLGTGFAGQGHALALRDAGVEIVGMAGRIPEVVEQITRELEIPDGSLDWHEALAHRSRISWPWAHRVARPF